MFLFELSHRRAKPQNAKKNERVRRTNGRRQSESIPDARLTIEMTWHRYGVLFLPFALLPVAQAFQPLSIGQVTTRRSRSDRAYCQLTYASTEEEFETREANRAQPRTGLAQSLLNFALSSPLWKYVLVPQARANIVKTAESNGVRWNEALEWIKVQGPWDGQDKMPPGVDFPEYYLKPFHAYEDGNINWDAAWEQELAGRAVGARNFPEYGPSGEDAFRSAFDKALDELGAVVPQDSTIVDMGCGTGTSTRRLAERYPQAKSILAFDLSPNMVAVGKRLLELAPKGVDEGGPWVTTIRPDDRIHLTIGDAASTGLPDSSAGVVNIGLVVHELPIAASIALCEEALRILKPGGQLWLTEMDFDSPAFAAQRSNPLLFSLIRSTEPFLDEYADGCADLRAYISKAYQDVKICAATGRHYALIATKPVGGGKDDVPADASQKDNSIIDDRRFNADGSYAVADTHLKTWETKKN